MNEMESIVEYIEVSFAYVIYCHVQYLGIPVDLLDRLMIIATKAYSEEELGQILKIRYISVLYCHMYVFVFVVLKEVNKLTYL